MPSLLPASGFRPHRINAQRRASRLTSDRNLIFGTAFRSPEKTARYRATFPRSILLAYPFSSPLKLSPDPFDQAAPPRRLVSPTQREFFTADPLPGSCQTASTVLQLSTSAWGFCTPPDQSVKLNTSREAHQIETPDFRYSPLPAVLIEPAADQSSELATSRLAYCLTNLLEPPSLCSRIDLASTKKYKI